MPIELECYFCGETKGLKAVQIDDIDDDDSTDESCCLGCFNDPDNHMEEAPIGSTEWYSTDYNWNNESHVKDSTPKE